MKKKKEETRIVKCGRPKIGSHTFFDGWDKAVIAAYTDGKSDLYVARTVLGIGRPAFYEVFQRDPVFRAVVTKGRELAEIWWEELGQMVLARGNNNFNTTMYIFQTCNRYKWKRMDDKAPVDPDASKRIDINAEDIIIR